MRDSDVPEAAYRWLTPEIKKALGAITGPHVQKKRATIIHLAFAVANQQPIVKVFESDDTCNEATWYTKWQYIPEVKGAFGLCRKRALEWADEDLAARQAAYRRERLLGIARNSAQAPDALALVMLDQAQKGGDRISAANSLLTWADPEAAGKAQPAAPPNNTDFTAIGILAGLKDDELDALIANAEAASSYAEAGKDAPGQSGQPDAEEPAGDEPAGLDDAPASDD